MASNLLVVVGTQISFADHAGDFSPTAAYTLEVGTPTDVDLAMASLAAGSAVNSDKVDLGATRAPQYSVMGVFEVASAAAVAGETIDLYWAPSPQSTAANGNPGGADGVDGAYAGTGADSMANSLRQLMYIGSHIATIDDTADSPEVQIGFIGVFSPPERYGQLVVVNNLTGNFHSDDVEMHIVFNPIIPQGQ